MSNDPLFGLLGRRVRRIGCLFLAGAGCWLSPVPWSRAEDASAELVEPADWTIRAQFDPFDDFQEWMSQNVFGLARWTDALFDRGLKEEDLERLTRRDRLVPGRGFDQEIERSYVRFSPVVRVRQSGETDFDFDFSANLRLPRARRRARLVLDRSDWRADLGRDFEGPGGAEFLDRESTRGSAGLDVQLYERTRLRLSARAGLNFRPEPEPRLQLAVYGRYPLGLEWNLLPRQSVFWDYGEGFGTKTILEVERRFAGPLIFRTGNELIWSEVSRGVDLGQYVNVYYFLSNRRVIGAKFGVFEHTRPNFVVDEYRIRFPYRQQIWKEWLYIEIEPGGRFRRDDNYEFEAELTITIDLLAGRIPE